MIPRLPHPWPSTGYPYEVLESVGISPQSSHEDVLAASLQLMAKGLLTADRRRAWDRLRLPAERLATDFFLYHPSFCDIDAMVSEAIAKCERDLLQSSE